MMAERHDLEALFEEALELAPAQRTAFLDRIKAQDPAAYAEIISLLDAHDDAPSFFDRLADAVVAPLFAQLDEEPAQPTRVGRYHLVREIGRGGMSTVYLAQRADGHYEQQVALKLVRSGVDEQARRQRFRSERQILASLSHPNVARLFDGGVLDDGRPYLVMEYVEGEQIDRYCDGRRLALGDRLRLFHVVIEAVQYAHSNLIVHRDLKPSNILVTNQGQIKLLDFGIAKLLDADDATDASATQTRSRWMTPEYAAPEQIRGERITTATDVYQLGVLLYQLLTGHRPYRVDTTSTYAIEQAVCEKEPTRPSTVVGKVEEIQRGAATVRITPEAVSQTRSTELPVLRRTLTGDLDAILLKTLRKEPDQRYATAEALSEDLRRYLEGRPVKARRGTLGYRIRKYVQRNRWGVAAIAAFALLLMVYVATITLQQQRVAQERDRARTEAAKATQVTDFLINLFELADPEAVNLDSITARQLLDQGARQIRALYDQPRAQAQLMAAIGRVYEKLGLYAESRHLLDSSLVLRRRALPGPHLDLAEGHYLLAHALFNTSAYRDADTHLQEAFALWNHFPEASGPQAKGLALQALLSEQRGDYAAAESLSRRALTLQRSAFGPAHPDIAETLNQLASLRRDQGDYTLADSLYQQALHTQRTLLGKQHLDVAATLNNLAALRFNEGRYPAADSLYGQALEILRRNLGDAHPDLARVLNNVGILRHRMGRLASAEALLRQALALRKRFLGPTHAGMAIAYYNLAGVHHDAGDYAAAESLYQQALAIDRANYGDEHPEIAVDLSKLATVYQANGNTREAERLFEQALAMGRRTLPANHPRLADLLVAYGRALTNLSRPAEAEALLRDALAIREEADAALDIAEVRHALGRCLSTLRRYEEAETLLVESHRILTANLDPEHYRTQRVRDDLIVLYDAWGRPDDAARYRAPASTPSATR